VKVVVVAWSTGDLLPDDERFAYEIQSLVPWEKEGFPNPIREPCLLGLIPGQVY